MTQPSTQSPPPQAPKSGLQLSPWLLAVAVVVGLYIFFGGKSSSTSSVPIVPGDGAPETRTVTYTLEGSATSADITYTDSSGNIQQQNGVSVPLETKDGREGLTFSAQAGDFVQFSAQNQGASGDLDCAIIVAGGRINTGHASGGYAIVSCSARVP